MSRQAVPGHMFVWRYADLERRPGALFGDLAWPLDFPKPNLCDLCGEARLLFRRGRFISGSNCGIDRLCICPVCGWSYRDHVYPDWYQDKASLAVLKECDVSDRDVLLAELGTHLRRRRQDVYDLAPRRFEELVEDVFRQFGAQTVLTAASRDNGADIILLRNDRKDAWAIVECKRYAASRKVGVDVIRCLAGAAVDWQVRNAYLVTSSSYSRDARTKALDYRQRGIEIDLVAMADLVSLLEVYNAELPRLDALTADDRRELKELRVPAVMAAHARFDGRSWEERVRERAYEKYLRRREDDGCAADDWFRAEAEIRFEDSVDGIPM